MNFQKTANPGEPASSLALVLFVCTGNICRSPMAEQIFAQKAARLNVPVSTASAGISAGNGDPMTGRSAEAMTKRGYTAKTHRSQRLTPKLLAEADLVLTATIDHKNAAIRMLPESSKNIFTIDEFAKLVSILQTDSGFMDQFRKQPQDSSEQSLRAAIELAVSLRGSVSIDIQPKDVADPYGLSSEVYDQVAEEIDELLEIIMDWMAA